MDESTTPKPEFSNSPGPKPLRSLIDSDYLNELVAKKTGKTLDEWEKVWRSRHLSANPDTGWKTTREITPMLKHFAVPPDMIEVGVVDALATPGVTMTPSEHIAYEELVAKKDYDPNLPMYVTRQRIKKEFFVSDYDPTAGTSGATEDRDVDDAESWLF